MGEHKRVKGDSGCNRRWRWSSRNSGGDCRRKAGGSRCAGRTLRLRRRDVNSRYGLSMDDVSYRAG